MDAAYTGNQIAQRRKDLGLTQKMLAEKLNVTDKAVSKWERGINFPDLGLMETLAAALETTPACLLGLESADQNEIVSSMSELSSEQLETAQRDMRITGWCCLMAVALLTMVCQWIPRHTVQAYQTLYAMITVGGFAGLTVLYKYHEIKPWDIEDAVLFYGAMIAVGVHLLIQFVTGSNPHPLLALILIAVAACCIQQFFCRILRAVWAKALPVILTSGFALWQLWIGNRGFVEFLPALCCLIVFLLWLTKQKQLRRPAPRAFRIVLCILLLAAFVCVFLFYPSLVRLYVAGAHVRLEEFSQAALEQGDADPYGFWTVHVYPESGMVQFHTGGSGLAPGSIYEGFYYSREDTHLPFQGWDMELDIQGDTAYWYEDPLSSDNWGQSIRITEHFYWYEAHF